MMMVEMVSDLVCPWCWLGLRRLQSALAQLDQPDAVEVKFRPFQLAPELPAEGADYKTFLKEKFGDSDDRAKSKWAGMRDMLERIGEEEGIPFRFDAISRRPNTTNAHRLVRWAQGQKMGAKAKEVLFDAYFHRALDIGDKKVLVSLSEEIGLFTDVVEKLIYEDADKGAVIQEEQLFRSMGVNGVPVFILDRRFAMQGAQDVDQMVRFLKQGLEAADKDAKA